MKCRINMMLKQCCLLAIVTTLAFMPAAHAKGEWWLFTDVTATKRDLPPSLVGKMEELDFSPSVALFGNLNKGDFQVLFGGVISDDEAEIERLQLGWNINPTNTLWFGRFHNPFDYWTSKFHHGLYFQTSQLRPGSVEFEDEGGVMPLHLSGFLLEGLYPTRGMGGIRYDLALGVGPSVGNSAAGSVLDAPTALSLFEKRREHKLAATAKVAYLPDAVAEEELGLFISRVVIPTEELVFIRGDITQTSVGVFGNWQYERIQLFGTAMFMRHEQNVSVLNQSGSEFMRLNMGSGYIQGEYTLTPRWRGYARLESTRGAENDPYIQSFAMYIKKRQLLGFRYDFYHNQALKMEISRAEHQHGDDAFNAVSLQWSALFR